MTGRSRLPNPRGDGREQRGLSHPPAPESAARPSASAPSSAPASAEPASPSSRAPSAAAIAAAAAGWRPSSTAGRAAGPAWLGWLRPAAPLLPRPLPAGFKGNRSLMGGKTWGGFLGGRGLGSLEIDLTLLLLYEQQRGWGGGELRAGKALG